MKKPPSKPTLPNAPASISAEQLAGLCNLTKRRLYQLADDHKLPQPVNGQFPMLAAITALFAYYQRDGESLQREKMLKTTAERKLREHELAMTEGKYLKKSDVERDVAGIGRILNANLDRFLEVRLRVLTLERLNQRPPMPPLTPEQTESVVTAICAIGVEANTTIKAQLKAGLYALKATEPKAATEQPTI
jgi:hypothetical protein